MAGYLGTLFMGGVGIRLILPPATEFNKLTSRLQKGLSNAQTVGENIANRFAARRKNKLERDLNQADTLIASIEKSANAEKMGRLKKLLQHIEKEHKVSMQRALSRMRNLKKGFREGGFGGSLKGEGALADIATARAFKVLPTPFEESVGKIAGFMGVIVSRTVRWAKALAGVWANAMRTSIMWIITFGYQMSIMLKGFMDFERELINANSIFQTTRENLYAMSDEVIKFGYKFGINYGDASKVLYQFASAGLTAEESMVALKDTLTLTMAVQGDFNTLGKLMVQVIKGFGLEMEDTAEIADKFAYTINKSLIEWKDLSAAVKFAMPFFVAAGQSIDQLLGSLQILTDRALEAGIAGRGLRQAIAQFVEHADDNNAAFRKLGVEILDTEGNMRALTDIALQFEAAMGEDVSQMDIMMTLMQDLNIRGATAFVHLAQNATEFQAAVNDLVNSQGESNKMAELQQASLTNQIQLVKNAIFSIFFLSDATYAGTGAINAFDYAVKDVVETIKTMFLKTMADGTVVLTEFGFQIRDVAVKFMITLGNVIIKFITILENMSKSTSSLYDTVRVLFFTLKETADFLAAMDPKWIKMIFQIWLLGRLFGTAGGALAAFAFGMRQFGEYLEGIHPWLKSTAYYLIVIAAALGGAYKGAMAGAAIGSIIPGVGTGVGAAIGGTIGFAAGGALGYGTMKAVDKMATSDVYEQSWKGAPTPLPSYTSQGPTDIYAENLHVANDDLNYRAANEYGVSSVG